MVTAKPRKLMSRGRHDEFRDGDGDHALDDEGVLAFSKSNSSFKELSFVRH